MPLVTVGLPVRNGVDRLPVIVASVLAQDHQDLELLITDNASTDATPEYCRELAAGDDRVTYHRHPENIGILGNFQSALRLGRGEFFRWVSDDDWIAPNCVSRSLRVFEGDDRLLMVTSQLGYLIDGEGEEITERYEPGGPLGSADPVVRLRELLRVLTLPHTALDPLYALLRREPTAAIERVNSLREDQIFAAKLALAGPWGHVPEVLGRRNWKDEDTYTVVKRLGAPNWQAHVATTFQCRRMVDWIGRPDAGLTAEQQRAARAAVHGFWLERQRGIAKRRARRVRRLVTAGR